MANALSKLFGDIANAIRSKTGETATMKPSEFPSKISAIDTSSGGTDTSDATAMASDIRLGQTAYVNGEKITGTLEIHAAAITLSATGLTLPAFDTYQLSASLLPTNSTDTDKITWESSNPSIATVENGLVTWVGYGNCTITAKIVERDISASCPVTCSGIMLSFEQYHNYVEAFNTITFKPVLSPANDELLDDIIWSSSRPEVATVENGVVTWVSPGSVTIEASLPQYGLAVVQNMTCGSAKLTLEEESLTLPVEGTATVTAYLYPANEEVLRQIVWASDDESVATVENGVVTWVGYGTCTITASIPAYDLSASCFVRSAAVPTDIMSHFKYLGPTTYSPGTYTAWCPTGLIYDETRDVYVQMMNVQNAHYQTPNVCELWCNTIDANTLEHTEPVFIARTGGALSGSIASYGALGCCIKNGIYYMFSKDSRGYYKSIDGGSNWTHEAYETGPDGNPWGCYVLGNGRMIMGSDIVNHKVYYSDDDGKNWTTVQSENFNEPTFVDFGNGTLMAICRENRDSENNIKPPWMHVSYDYGETWTASVAMTSVGLMGDNNCNAYVHDNYVELFVGCRNSSKYPQWDEYHYKINQYVLDLNKGPVDEFEFVNTVYAFKDGDNPQGMPAGNGATAEDFSTPVIAIKDKSHALLSFYAPNFRYVTHHLIAVGNLPVDEFEIPKPLPQQFNASQDFTVAPNTTATICDSYGITYRDSLPRFTVNAYFNISDIEEGGYVHAKATLPGVYNGWELPCIACVEDRMTRSRVNDAYMARSPLPEDATTYPTGPCQPSNIHWYPTDGTVFDIYARFKDKAWWVFYGGSWLRFYTNDVGVEIPEGITSVGDYHHYAPYVNEGLETYTMFALTYVTASLLHKFEYDKKQNNTVSVTTNCTDVVSSNTATETHKDMPYKTTLTGSEWGYVANNVVVTMGGVDITSSVYKDGQVLIPWVTGAITITANATPMRKGELLHSWDFATGLTDSVGGKVATLNAGATQNETGVTLSAFNHNIKMELGKPITNKIYEIDVADVSENNIAYYQKKFFMSTMNGSATGVIHNGNSGWSTYTGTQGKWDQSTNTDLNIIEGKTVTCYISADNKIGMFVDGNDLCHSTVAETGTPVTSVTIGAGSYTLLCTITGLRVYDVIA